MPAELQQPLRGIVPPVATPLTDDGKLDVEALERVIEHLVDGGVHGLFMLGTTGEGPSLSGQVRRDLVQHTCRLVDSRLPVYVGITDTSLAESLALAGFAADRGCDAVVAAPPYYFPTTQQQLSTYYRSLSAQLPLPLVLYNMPALTHTMIEADTVRQLVDVPAIVGMKDSSGDPENFRQLVTATTARPEFALLVGPEHLTVETMAMGGVGVVPGGANIWPQLLVQLYNACVENNAETTQQCQAQLHQLGAIYRIEPRTIPANIARIKAAMSLLGLCSAHMAAPLTNVEAETHLQIQEILTGLGLIGSKQTVETRTL